MCIVYIESNSLQQFYVNNNCAFLQSLDILHKFNFHQDLWAHFQIGFYCSSPIILNVHTCHTPLPATRQEYPKAQKSVFHCLLNATRPFMPHNRFVTHNVPQDEQHCAALSSNNHMNPMITWLLDTFQIYTWRRWFSRYFEDFCRPKCTIQDIFCRLQIKKTSPFSSLTSVPKSLVFCTRTLIPYSV